MPRQRKPVPDASYVILRDYRSRWDGVVAKVLAGPHLERSVGPGEIAVFEPTGETVEAVVDHETREGNRPKTVEAAVYRRVRTRLVLPISPRLI